MDVQLNEVSQLSARFKAAFTRNDFSNCANLLSRIKVMLTKFPSLPPSFQQTPNAVQELTIAREIFEHAVILDVKIEDQDAFERDFFQLKPYYTDTCGVIPTSPQEYPILGLNLLRLLVQNRIAEFHTELELLPASALENPCIRHAVELEQSFMEGAYNRVLSARQTVPHDTYVYFMDLLAKTVRDEIAGCSEKAYDYLSIADAKKILLFSTDQELSQYITEVKYVVELARALAATKGVYRVDLLTHQISSQDVHWSYGEPVEMWIKMYHLMERAVGLTSSSFHADHMIELVLRAGVDKNKFNIPRFGLKEASVGEICLQFGLRSASCSLASSSGFAEHPLLAPCLNGLGKFSHLIDVDFMGDLMNCLKKLAGYHDVSSFQNKLSVSKRLQCCIVAFQVMRTNLDRCPKCQSARVFHSVIQSFA